MAYQKIVLKNGLRVILSPVSGINTLSTLVLVKTGSRYESEDIAGISHFLEHMVFRGTDKFSSSEEISGIMDSIGAEFNAFTDRDNTGFYIKAKFDRAELSLDVLSQLVLHPKLLSENIEREKPIIVEEIKMYEDNPMAKVEDIFAGSIYKKNPLGRNIAGYRETVLDINREKLLSYYEKYYHASNMVLVMAGNIPSNALELIEKYFGNFSSKEKSNFVEFKEKQKKAQLVVVSKKVEQVQMIVGFPAFSYFDSRFYAAKVLSLILGGNMSSRLFVTVREKNSLCYFIKSSLESFADTGAFLINIGLDQKNIDKALELINSEILKIKEEFVSPEELLSAQEFYAGRMALKLENSYNLASFLGMQELMEDKIVDVNEKIELIRKVKIEEIKQVAGDIFNKNKLNIAIVGQKISKSALQNKVFTLL